MFTIIHHRSKNNNNNQTPKLVQVQLYLVSVVLYFAFLWYHVFYQMSLDGGVVWLNYLLNNLFKINKCNSIPVKYKLFKSKGFQTQFRNTSFIGNIKFSESLITFGLHYPKLILYNILDVQWITPPILLHFINYTTYCVSQVMGEGNIFLGKTGLSERQNANYYYYHHHQ